MVIIDAHSHPDWHGHDLAKTLENMDRYNIRKSWLLSWEVPDDEWDHGAWAFQWRAGEGPIPFSRCLSYKERAPERFVLGYMPDPRRPGAVDRLVAAKRIYGVQVCGELKLRMTYDSPDAIRLFRVCGEEGLPVTVHIDYEFGTGHSYPRPNWWYGGGIGAFERALKLCPGTAFLGHAPGFWAHISDDGQHDKAPYPKGRVVPGGEVERLLRQCPNLYCDISAGSGHNALSRDIEYTKGFLAEFQDRVLYARDYFDNVHQELLDSLGLPVGILEKIYHKNAEKLAGA